MNRVVPFAKLSQHARAAAGPMSIEWKRLYVASSTIPSAVSLEENPSRPSAPKLSGFPGFSFRSNFWILVDFCVNSR